MSTAETSTPACAGIAEPAKKRHGAWDYGELIIGYGLILAVIWTQRPLQRWLYWIALAWFVATFAISFPGWKTIGCSIAVIWRSWWIVGVALLLGFSAALLAASPYYASSSRRRGCMGPRHSAGYTLWAAMQQFLLQGYFLIRLQRILPSATLAAITAATVFALAHLPNPILAPITLLWGFAACLVFLRFRNIWPLAVAHAIFGICVAITIPGPVVHNMRVGRGYLTYRAPRHLHLNHKDQRVSTVAWVRDDAPTRR